MKSTIKDLALLAGRISFALLFLPAGLGKISGFEGFAGSLGAQGIPLPEVAAAIAILLEVGGSIALLLGIYPSLTAIGLIVFTVAASLIFHRFWGMDPASAGMQQTMFFKNLAVAGGMAFYAYTGPGHWSLAAPTAATASKTATA